MSRGWGRRGKALSRVGRYSGLAGAAEASGVTPRWSPALGLAHAALGPAPVVVKRRLHASTGTCRG